jgi:HEAT repeat protein
VPQPTSASDESIAAVVFPAATINPEIPESFGSMSNLLAWAWESVNRPDDLRLMREAEARARRPVDAWEADYAFIDLAGACGSPEPAVAGAAGEELARRMDALDAGDLVRVDAAVRHVLHRWAPYARIAPLPRWLRDGELSHLRVGGRARTAALGVLSMHRDGRVREQAVRALAEQRGGGELPFLILRTNDWVPPVRVAASAAIEARLEPSLAAAWVRWLPLALRMRGWTRADHGPLVDAILSLLGRAECRGAVLDGLTSDDRWVRRSCYRLLAEHDDGLREAIEAALQSPDAVLRLYAARDVRRLEENGIRALLPRLFADRSGPIRAEAAQLAVRLGPETEPVLRRAMLDPYGLVRTVAASALAKVGVDVEAAYRDALSGDRAHAVAALEWLGGRRDPGDAGLVAGFLSDPRPRVRAAAVEAYARIARAEAAPVLDRMLADESPRVVRAAAREAVRRRIHAGSERLEALFSPANPAHVRAAALRLLARGRRWRAIPLILSATGDGDVQMRERATTYLRRWIDRQFIHPVAPTSEELMRFDAVLTDAGDRVASGGWMERLSQIREHAARLQH